MRSALQVEPRKRGFSGGSLWSQRHTSGLSFSCPDCGVSHRPRFSSSFQRAISSVPRDHPEQRPGAGPARYHILRRILSYLASGSPPRTQIGNITGNHNPASSEIHFVTRRRLSIVTELPALDSKSMIRSTARNLFAIRSGAGMPP